MNEEMTKTVQNKYPLNGEIKHDQSKLIFFLHLPQVTFTLINSANTKTFYY